MKNKLSLVFLFIFSLFLSSALTAQAETSIFDIKQGALEEGKTVITWVTSDPTTSYIIFGKTETDLPFYVGDLNLSRTHSADLTGLKKDQAYYYKIVATNQNGEKAESFVNYLDTQNMPDTRAAIISNVKKLQAIDTAFALSFTTDEPVKVEIKYGTSKEALNKSWKNGALKQEHTAIITSLKASTRYYYEIIVKDEDNNVSTTTGDLTTANQGAGDIKISKLTPESAKQAPAMAENAIITWESNLLTTAEIIYGLEPKKLNKTLKVTATSSLIHKATLSKLEPNKTYYYQIKLKSELNNKSFTSQIYSFKTAALDANSLGLYFKSGDLVKYKNTVYLIYNGTKIAINNSDKIKTISTATPKTIEEKYWKVYKDSPAYWGVFHDGQLIKEEKGSTVYLIDGQSKRPIAKWEILKYLGYSSKDIIIAKSGQLKSYKLGAVINNSKEITTSALNNKLVKSATGSTVYLIANGKKMPFFNQQAFLQLGYNFKDVKKISDKDLKNLPEGQLIIQ